MYAELQHRQVTAQRDVTGDAFPRGVIDYNFSIGGSHGWIPSKSYFRIGLKLTKPDGTPPTDEEIAFADNPCANLFTNVYARAGGQDISSIVNYSAQADQVAKRIQKTGAWLDNLGEVYGMEPKYTVRRDRSRAAAAAGGNEADVYFIWQPPIGLMNHSKPLGSGDYRIQLNPNANYKTALVESLADIPDPSAVYQVQLTEMELYVANCRVAIPPSGVEKLELFEHQAQSKQITGSDQTLDFTVPTSTKYISVFVQSAGAGTNNVVPLTKFKTIAGDEQLLQSIQLSYANSVKPTTRWSSQVNAVTGTQKLQQRYLDSKIASGMLFNPGGAESFADWRERGLLLHYDFMRDSDDRSSQLQVQVSFPPTFNVAANNYLFIVAHYSRVVEITTDRGFVTSVNAITA